MGCCLMVRRLPLEQVCGGSIPPIPVLNRKNIMIRKQLVFVENPDIQSLASFVLLQREYFKLELNEYIIFRDKFLSEFKVLTCFWCGKQI